MISEKMKKMIESGSAIREMFEEGKRLSAMYGKENVFDFSLGNPSVKPPACIGQEIVRIASDVDPSELHGYMNNSGFSSTRNAVADYFNKRYGTDYDEKNVVMTVGAAGGLNVALKSLLNPGDEVMVFCPYFGEYRNYIDNFGGKIVEVPANAPSFVPDMSVAEKLISAKTKAVIINSPNNPTGVVYDKSFLTALADTLKKAQDKWGSTIYLISDEPYREITYDGVQVEFLPALYDNTVVGYSYSKSLSLPGERIGYLLIPDSCADFEELIAACNVATRILGFVNAPSLQQKLVEKCLEETCEVGVYEENKKLLTQGLDSFGFEYVKPQGAFYLFVKSPVDDDKEFCKIAKKYNLLLVPGSSFGCKGYVRIAYCVAKDVIVRSMAQFEKLAKEMKLI
ncbi:MAG: pyridoxal phosphate-dependent aminotransferase [Christensenellales bacterium]